MGRNVAASSSNTTQPLSANTLSVGYGLSFVGQAIAYPFPKDQGAKLRQDLDKSDIAARFEGPQSAEQIFTARKLVARTKNERIVNMNKDHICGFLLGLSAGGSIALLFAPRSGKKTRSQIAQAAADGVTYVKECGETVRDTTRGLVERGKEKVAQQKDSVANTVNQARDAYEEAVR